MPYQQIFVPAPRDLTLPVHRGDRRHPPFGYQWWTELYGVANAEHLVTRKRIYFCYQCDGWVDGWPHEYRVHTLAVLSGREGIEFYCRRCGNEIAFFGKMA